jgi:hypothetical protein
MLGAGSEGRLQPEKWIADANVINMPGAAFARFIGFGPDVLMVAVAAFD